MKIFLVVCLAVAALADSDPQLLLNSPFYSGLAYPQQMLYLKPELKVEAKPELKEAKEEKKEVKVEIPQIYAAPAVQSIYSYAAYPYTQIVPKYIAKNGAVEHIVAKREAEAEAEPQMYYGMNPMYYNTLPAQQMFYGLNPMYYNTAPVAAKTYANDFSPYTQNYAAKGQYIADSVGARHVAKREAEAEAEPQMYYGLNPMYYNTKPLVYNTQPMIYNTQPMYYNTLPAQQMSYNTLPAAAKTYANDFNPYTQNYASKGQYVADSVGARHVAKREAEAEPQFYSYNSLYNGAYAPYRTPYTYGYNYAQSYNPIYSGLNYPVYG